MNKTEGRRQKAEGSSPTRRSGVRQHNRPLRASHSSLITHHSSLAFRSAFTIIELIVSVGILGILLVVAGSVFTLTLKSSGQANALIEVSEQLSTLEQTLRADLLGVQPGRSLMIIQPGENHGMWTKDELDLAVDSGAGDLAHKLPTKRDPEREHIDEDLNRPVPDLPRVDRLLFVTDRPAVSNRDPDVSGRSQVVMYGHAQLGEFSTTNYGKWAGGVSPEETWDFDTYSMMYATEADYTPPGAKQIRGHYAPRTEPVDPGSLFSFPAEQWHLARRVVIIVDRDLAPPSYYPAATLNDSEDGLDELGVPARDNEPRYRDAGLDAENYIIDGRREYIVNGSPGFDLTSMVAQRKPNPEFDAPVFTPAVNDPDPSALIYWIRRSQLAVAPTASQSQRLGAYFLPNCANFKVEWALDVSDVDYGPLRGTDLPGAREPIWIDPLHLLDQVEAMQPVFDDYRYNVCADMFSSLPEVLDCQARVAAIERAVIGKLVPHDPTVNPQPANQLQRPQEMARCLAEHKPSRFVDPGPDGTNSGRPKIRNTHIFYSREPQPSCYYDEFEMFTTDPNSGMTAPPEVPDPLFPKALRITVDVYDPAGRLERPIRHVMVLPVGSD